MYKNILETFAGLSLFATAFSLAQTKPHLNSAPVPYQTIPSAVNEILDSAQQSLHPKEFIVVVAEPRSGKIVAMHGNAICFLTEPVSTFKPFVMVAALENDKINQSTRIDCENGAFKFGNRTIKDSIPFGELDYAGIVEKNSNIGISKVALLLDDNQFYDAAKRFGFGETTGISLPNEIPGFIKSYAKWDSAFKLRLAIGQNLLVTPIQIAMAYCALANDGKLMRPIMENEKPQFVRQVCSEKTARMVRKAMQSVASESGAAPLAAVEGVSVGGSPGTAQLLSPEARFVPNHYVTMFAGFFPVDHPEYVIVVVVNDADLPPRKNYGALVAAPIFSKIADKIRSLGLLSIKH